MADEGKRNPRAATSAVATRDVPFEAFIDAVRDYAIFMLDPAGHVTSWNIGAERLKGYRSDEIIGRHFSVFYPDEDRAAGKPAAILALAATEGRVRDEGWRVRKDRSRFWADVVVTAVRDRRSNLLGFAKVTRDMTDVHAQRTALETANHELRRTNDALEAFTRSMTHDIASPLRTIRGFADILLEEYGARLDGEARDYLNRIAASADRLAALAHSLLTLSRITRAGEMPSLQRVSLDEVVGDAMRDLQNDIDRSAAAIQVRTPLGEVLAHRPFLSVIVQNLLRNAMKFVPAGTTPHVTISSSRGEQSRRLTVEDNGIGIAADERQMIFRPFTRLHTRASFEGTGLGLAIVKHAVERMGGGCGVESAPGAGSRFWVDLYAAD